MPVLSSRAALYFSDKVFLAQLAFLGISCASVFWLSFAIEYADFPWWKRSRHLPLLFVIPVLITLPALFSLYFNLPWFPISPLTDPTGTYIVWSHTLVFWILLAYTGFLFFSGMVIMLFFILTHPGYFRRQLFIILFSTLVVGLGIALFALGSKPVLPLDFLPLAFVFGGLVYTLTIFRLKFLDIVPIARETLIERLPDGILVLNKEGVIADFNPAVKKMGGDKVKSGRKLALVWPQMDLLREKLGDGQRTEILLGSGPERCLDISSIEITGSQGKKTGQIIVFKDVTAQKLTQRKLEELYRNEKLLSTSLQEEIENRSKYTRALVHELKTPLTSILTSSEMLNDGVPESTLVALTRNIRKSSLNLEQRINELLDLAKGEIGLLKIRAMPLNMAELLQDIVAETSPIASAKGLSLESSIPELPAVIGDSTRLRQIMANLLSNALKFTSMGIVTVTADNVDGENVLVQVTDTGRGIEPERLRDLFDPYRRKINEGEALGGLGVGLALTKMFVELHGGKIWVESQLRNGSIFSFTIPVYKL